MRGAARAPWPAALLLAFAALAIADLVAVRVRVLPARPEWVWALALLPLVVLVIAIGQRATRLAVAAVVELGLAALLHQILTFIRAWRLE